MGCRFWIKRDDDETQVFPDTAEGREQAKSWVGEHDFWMRAIPDEKDAEFDRLAGVGSKGAFRDGN